MGLLVLWGRRLALRDVPTSGRRLQGAGMISAMACYRQEFGCYRFWGAAGVMFVFMRRMLPVFALLILTASSQAQTATTFCDLLRNPEKYNGRVVKVRATYKFFFEMSLLYCLDCLDKGEAWLEQGWPLDKASEKALRKLLGHGAGTANITVEGVFEYGRHYGHLGAPYQITARRISNVAVITRGAKDPVVEREREKKWACGGTSPK
jgi:hypothetical protein